MNRDRPAGSVQSNRPWSFEIRLGRKVQTESNTELALFPVGVLLELCSAQVRREVNVGRLQRFAGNGAKGRRKLSVEESRDRVVVRHVPAANFGRRQAGFFRCGSGTGNIGAGQQYGKDGSSCWQRRITFLSKIRRCLLNCFLPMALARIGMFRRGQDTRGRQH